MAWMTQFITTHILPELAFDVILGYPTIRKYELLIHFSSLFTGKSLQLHNCKSCRQCLPAVHQQAPLTTGATQAEVLLVGPRLGTLAVARDCCRLSKGGLDVAAIGGSPRQSHHEEGGLNVAVIKDSPRELQLDAATIQGATCESHRAEGGLGVATNKGATLRSHRHSEEGGVDVASRQARDRQVQYLNAQQARLESEVEREFFSGSSASYFSRQELTDASDLAPVEINRHRKHADAH
jgi:hypothetical protein